MRFNNVKTTTISSLVMATVAVAAYVETYDFSCTEYGALPFFTSSSGSSWFGSFVSAFDDVEEQEFLCSPLGFGITPLAEDRTVPLEEGVALVPTSPMLVSELPMEGMKKHYNQSADSLSFDFWITPSTMETTDVAVPIFTIGQPEESPSSAMDGFSKSCEGFDFQFSQLDSKTLEIFFSDDDTILGGARCRGLPFEIPAMASNDQGSLTQVVVVLSPKKLGIYLNGKSLFGEDIPIDFIGNLENWNSTYQMQLFSNYLDGFSIYQKPTFFEGSIHRLSVYDYSLDTQSVEALYNNGMAEIPSMPKVAEPGPRKTPIEVVSEEPSLLPTLDAMPSTNISIPQDHVGTSAITLLGTTSINTTSPESTWTLQVEILSLPTQGTLRASDNATIQAGDRVDAIPLLNEDTVVATVNYELQSAEYFNTPRVSAKGEPISNDLESFQYRLVAVSLSSGEVLVESSPATQQVHVIHVNHPSALTTSLKSIIMEDSFETGQLDGRLPAGLIQDAIKLEDPKDFNLDKVRVNIWAGNGVLTLSEQHRHLAEFPDNCRDRDFSLWQCVGDGIEDKMMTFLALPSDVELILMDMLYEAFSFGQPDEITIQVWDGEGGDCLSEQEHASSSTSQFSTIYREQCFEAMVIIEVEPLDGDIYRSDGWNWDLEDVLFLVCVGSCAFVVIVLCVTCYCACIRKKTGDNEMAAAMDEKIQDVPAEGKCQVMADKENTEENNHV